LIIEFRSGVDTVRCATEVQTGMFERNVPEERRMLAAAHPERVRNCPRMCVVDEYIVIWLGTKVGRSQTLAAPL
jgi:hypothetical protein